MLRNRMLIMLGGCFLASSATWADGVAFVDCSSHPEVTPVFGKPRRTPETVAGIPCGERFTILQNGFIFSRIQTKDGQIGYVYSNVISADRSGAALPQSVPARSTVAPSNIPAATTTITPSNPAPPAQPQGSSTQQAPAQPPVASVNSPNTAATLQVAATPPTQTQQTQIQLPAAPSVSAEAAVTAPSAPETRATIAPPPTSAAPEQPREAPTPSLATETAAPAATAAEPPATVAAPESPAAQPEPAPAQPAPAIRSVSMKESWEKPNPSVRTVGLPRLVPLIELFGGYAFARFDNGAGTPATNLNGVMGSFGWNVKPWLQLVADSSYNFVTVSGTKNVLYGNHWGARVFRRVRNRWGLTPFVEGLVGGTRADVTVSGVAGYKTSDNSLSYKVGGGLDIKPSRRFEIRLFDVDYYRTSFGPNIHQNNYWASAGIVVRLFGGSE